jgi:hypothetical protein
MKITKSQLQNIIREEMENLQNEYMGAYDRANDEEARERRARMARIRAEDERKRNKDKFKSSFFNRRDGTVKEDTFDKEEEHDDEDKDHLEKIRDEINRHIDMLKKQRDRAEGRHEEREDD